MQAISPISPMFGAAIEETQSLLAPNATMKKNARHINTNMNSKMKSNVTKGTRHRQTQHKTRKSVFSLSHIISTFGNASFSNLGSSFSLAPKISDGGKNQPLKSRSKGGNDAAVTSSTKRTVETDSFLTLNIIGIRDIDASEATSSAVPVPKASASTATPSTATIYDFVHDLETQVKTANAVAATASGSFPFPVADAKEESKAESKEEKQESKADAPLFPDDSSSEESTDSDSDAAAYASFLKASFDNSDVSTEEEDPAEAARRRRAAREQKRREEEEKAENEKRRRNNLCLKTVETRLTAASTIKELKEYLAQPHVFGLEENVVFQMYYANTLMQDDYRTLGYYGVCNNAFILVALLEGGCLGDREYKEQMEGLHLRRDIGLGPAQYQTGEEKSDGRNRVVAAEAGDGVDGLLGAFMRRHVRNVRNGVTAAPVRPSGPRRPSAAAKWTHLDMQDMVGKFAMEKMSCVDFITFEIDDNCIKMPCGHGIHPDSLLGYVLSEVNRKDTLSITCPHLKEDGKTLCRAVWHYPIIKKILIAAMEKEQDEQKDSECKKSEFLLNFMKIELLLARNMLQERFDAQKCGHCNSMLFRKQTTLTAKLSDFQAVCALCTAKHRRELRNEHNKKIAKLEARIAQMKKPTLAKTLRKMKMQLKRANPGAVKRELVKMKQKVVSVGDLGRDLKGHLKSKFSGLLIESIDEIESNALTFQKRKMIETKRYRRRKKIKKLDYATVPRSFLDAFCTNSDSDDESESEQKQRQQPTRQRLGIVNPYLLDPIPSDRESEVSSEYEYVSAYDADRDNGSDSDSSSSESSESESKESSVARGLFGDDDSSDDSDDSDVSGGDIFPAGAVRTGANANAYAFAQDNVDSDSGSERDAMGANRQAMHALFKTLSDSDSDGDDDDANDSKSAEVAAPVPTLTEDERKLARLEYKLARMRMRTFDNVGNNVVLCWGCGIAWKDVSSPACGNSECSTSFRAQIMAILTDCDTKKIGAQLKVPSVRACPKCGQLINHWSACKHIHCSRCDTNFCFVCLKKYLKGQGGWQCGSYSSKCPDGIKARQSIEDLPSMTVSTVTLFEL